MKRLITTMVLSVLVVVSAFAGGYSVVVSTVDTPVMPNCRKPSPRPTDWVSMTTYAPGTTIKGERTSDGFYWTPNGGTSTTLPTCPVYEAVTTPDGITWVHFKYGPRKALVFTGDSANVMHVNSDAPATVSGGLVLDLYALRCPVPNSNHAAFSAVVESGTGVIHVYWR